MTVVLVEGTSDRIAVETLAHKVGFDLERESIEIAVAGGAHALRRALAAIPPEERVGGLYDIGEEDVVRDALEAVGRRRDGFFACVLDLEDELIRAVGVDAVEHVAADQGDLAAFRTLQKQPQWRGKPVEEQLRRWLGSGGTRKTRYASLLVGALEADSAPLPLVRLLDYAAASRSAR